MLSRKYLYSNLNTGCVFSSVLIGEKSSIFGNKTEDDDEEEDDDNSRWGKGARVFNSAWLPGRDSKYSSSISVCIIYYLWVFTYCILLVFPVP